MFQNFDALSQDLIDPEVLRGPIIPTNKVSPHILIGTHFTNHLEKRKGRKIYEGLQ